MSRRPSKGGRVGSGKTPVNSPRKVELTLDQNTPVLTNGGMRPHGGYRGTKDHPPTIYSTGLSGTGDNRTKYHTDQPPMRPNSPAWALPVAHERNHSGEYPLFVHKLLPTSKCETLEEDRFIEDLRKKMSRSRPTTSQYYKPNSMHQYLASTELKDAAKDNVDTKFGKPTRTTLLRARQRCSSAPVTSLHERREQAAKAPPRNDPQRTFIERTGLTVKDLLYSPGSPTLHSYLTGARYNRAHCLDIKSYDDLGLYMTKQNPVQTYVTRKDIRDTSERLPPPTPPETPVSGLSVSDLDDLPSPQVSPRSGPYKAWGADPAPSPDIPRPMTDGLLNVKGYNSRNRPSTAVASKRTAVRPPSGRSTSMFVPPGGHSSSTQQQRSMSFPSVKVQGTSMGTTAKGQPDGRTPRNHDPIIDQTQQANQPFHLSQTAQESSQEPRPLQNHQSYPFQHSNRSETRNSHHVHYASQNQDSQRSQGSHLTPKQDSRLLQNQDSRLSSIESSLQALPTPFTSQLGMESSSGAQVPVVQDSTIEVSDMNQESGNLDPEIHQNSGDLDPDMQQESRDFVPELNQESGELHPEMNQESGELNPEMNQESGERDPEMNQESGELDPVMKQDSGNLQTPGDASNEQMKQGSVAVEIRETFTSVPSSQESLQSDPSQIPERTASSASQYSQKRLSPKPPTPASRSSPQLAQEPVFSEIKISEGVSLHQQVPHVQFSQGVSSQPIFSQDSFLSQQEIPKGLSSQQEISQEAETSQQEILQKSSEPQVPAESADSSTLLAVAPPPSESSNKPSPSQESLPSQPQLTEEPILEDEVAEELIETKISEEVLSTEHLASAEPPLEPDSDLSVQEPLRYQQQDTEDPISFHSQVSQGLSSESIALLEPLSPVNEVCPEFEAYEAPVSNEPLGSEAQVSQEPLASEAQVPQTPEPGSPQEYLSPGSQQEPVSPSSRQEPASPSSPQELGTPKTSEELAFELEELSSEFQPISTLSQKTEESISCQPYSEPQSLQTQIILEEPASDAGTYDPDSAPPSPNTPKEKDELYPRMKKPADSLDDEDNGASKELVLKTRCYNEDQGMDKTHYEEGSREFVLKSRVYNRSVDDGESMDDMQGLSSVVVGNTQGVSEIIQEVIDEQPEDNYVDSSENQHKGGEMQEPDQDNTNENAGQENQEPIGQVSRSSSAGRRVRFLDDD